MPALAPATPHRDITHRNGAWDAPYGRHVRATRRVRRAHAFVVKRSRGCMNSAGTFLPALAPATPHRDITHRNGAWDAPYGRHVRATRRVRRAHALVVKRSRGCMNSAGTFLPALAPATPHRDITHRNGAWDAPYGRHVRATRRVRRAHAFVVKRSRGCTIRQEHSCQPSCQPHRIGTSHIVTVRGMHPTGVAMFVRATRRVRRAHAFVVKRSRGCTDSAGTFLPALAPATPHRDITHRNGAWDAPHRCRHVRTCRP